MWGGQWGDMGGSALGALEGSTERELGGGHLVGCRRGLTFSWLFSSPPAPHPVLADPDPKSLSLRGGRCLC